VLTNFHGILTGVPTFDEDASEDLFEDRHAVTAMEKRILIYAPTGQDAVLASQDAGHASVDNLVTARDRTAARC
jgi:hypothetical protein